MYHLLYTVWKKWKESRELWQKPRAGSRRKQSNWFGVSLNYSYEDFTHIYNRYPKPIPLAELVDFVVEGWDLEG